MPEQGDLITVIVEYGEPLCNTCKHQELTLSEGPCCDCDILNILYEPEEE